MRKLMLLLALVAGCRHHVKPHEDAVCVVTARDKDNQPVGAECEWEGYLWVCDVDVCIRKHRVEGVPAEKP